MLLNIAMVVFAAPIVEELLYRKMLIDRIAAYGDGVSVVVSGLLFGLAHGNFSQFFYAFGLGALFAYVYIKTGHIGYTIGFHMFFNLIGGVFTVELNKGLMEVRDPAGMVARLEQIFGVDLGPVVPPGLQCAFDALSGDERRLRGGRSGDSHFQAQGDRVQARGEAHGLGTAFFRRGAQSRRDPLPSALRGPFLDVLPGVNCSDTIIGYGRYRK